ncbi:5467_t:CDS:2 [Diversispora eburnea]|uniref:5467_t:CDS:1 n=1 Tax=Diversispora eburnea TaxID=1213867 RepID=A0A9N8VIH0_9GLOM|nr:5467_t:CDS:2 [Diversispora eburnea]
MNTFLNLAENKKDKRRNLLCCRSFEDCRNLIFLNYKLFYHMTKCKG